MRVSRKTNIISAILAVGILAVAIVSAIKIINPESGLFKNSKTNSDDSSNINTTDKDLAKKYFLIPEMGLKIKYTSVNKNILDDLAYSPDSGSGFDVPVSLGSKSYTINNCSLSDAPLGKLKVISLASVDNRPDAAVVKANSVQVGANYIYYEENLGSCYASADKAKYPDVEELKLVLKDPQQLLPY